MQGERFPAALPLDEHNRRLLDQVHPSGWVNPKPSARYHLVVLGAGTAGLVTAAIAASLGARVALLERGMMGGDCLNVGCVPSKAVLRASRAWADSRAAAGRFGAPAAAGDGDFAAAMERMRRIRADLSPVDGARRFRDELGVDVYLGEARFVSGEAVEVGGTRLGFRRCVIATGARPSTPEIPGLREAGFLTSETVFSLTTLPARLVVIGGGAIGCELAQAFARFGSRVTLLDAGDRLLARDDADAAAVVESALRSDGVEVVLGASIDRIDAGAGGRRIRYSAGGESAEVETSELLLAAGRTPNLEGLELGAAGVERHDRGIRVDDRLRTTAPRIYAIGDVLGGLQFTHLADAHARMVVRNALFFGRQRASRLVVPWCTYTSPELAQVGLTAEAARAARIDVTTHTIPFREVDRARLDGEEEGFLRIHLAAGSDRILGATIVGAQAGELITRVTQAMVSGTGLARLGDAIYPYPTRADAIRRAADAHRRTRLTPRAQSIFRGFFRLTG